MKIGVLTQPLHNNYGGLLQNFALQQALKLMGMEPETIDHNRKSLPRWKVLLSYLTQTIMHWFIPAIYKPAFYQVSEREFSVISRNSRYFIDKYISCTTPFHTRNELIKLIIDGHYNGYVVGSDQCWRPAYSGSFMKEMFLDFVEDRDDIRRISYAASFGTDNWEFSTEMTEICAKLAKKFDYISVREISGVRLCKEYLGVDATHVLDPTMLLYKGDYIKIVQAENEPVSEGDLFYYILDPSCEKTDFINRVASLYGLNAFTVLPYYQAENRTLKEVKFHIEDCVYPSVTKWLRAFMDAKLVIVDSFHGAVFSIIFNKPFWVISNPYRGNARFVSLLNLFSLEDRLVLPSQLKDLDPFQWINWDRVNAQKEIMVGKSLYAFFALKDEQPRLTLYRNKEAKDLQYYESMYVDTEEDLEKCLDRLRANEDSLVFRGVNDARFKMYASSQRNWTPKSNRVKKVECPDYYDYIESRVRATEKLKDVSDYATKENIQMNDFFLLAIMQHFGVPSPMIDFTHSLNKGLFFATDLIPNWKDEGGHELDDYVSLYYISNKIDWIQTTVQSVVSSAADRIEERIPELKAMVGERWREAIEEQLYKIEHLSYKQFRLGFNSDIKFLPVEGSGKKSVNGGDTVNINIPSADFSCNYKIINDRILKQEGLFILNNTVDEPLVEVMNTISQYKMFGCLNIHKSLVPYIEDKYLIPNGLSHMEVYCDNDTIVQKLQKAINSI